MILILVYTLWLYQHGLGALEAFRAPGPGALLSFAKHSFSFEVSSSVSEICLLSGSHFSSFLGVGTSVMRKGIPQEATIGPTLHLADGPPEGVQISLVGHRGNRTAIAAHAHARALAHRRAHTCTQAHMHPKTLPL